MTATPDCINDEYRRMIEQLLPKYTDLKALALVGKARKIEIDLSYLNLAKKAAERDYKTDLPAYDAIENKTIQPML